MKRKYFWNGAGFTLVEVLIAAALLGGLALVIMNISREQTKAQKQTETNFEVNTIYSSIAQTLLNADACFNTLNPAGSILAEKALTRIVDRNNTTLFLTDNTYGNNKVKLVSITVKSMTFNPVPTATTKGYGNGNLSIVLQRIGVAANPNITRNVPLTVEVDNGYVVTKCYSATENAIDTAKINACQNINGVYDAATDSCNLSAFPGSVDDKTAVSTNYLQNFMATTLNAAYVRKSGDVMTGSLTSPTYCIGTNCRTTFALQNCGVGRVVSKINSDGSAICSNVTCPDPTTFFVGVDATGAPICKPFPTNTCSTSQYVSKVNTDGSVVCSDLPPNAATTCSAGQVIQSIAANGVPTCVTYHPQNLSNSNCGAGLAVTGFNADGTAKCATAGISNQTCPAGQVMTGITNGSITCSSPFATAPSFGGARYCIIANSCPSGWVSRGTIGIIAAYSGGSFSMCTGGNVGTTGANYNGTWGWCHPLICCNS